MNMLSKSDLKAIEKIVTTVVDQKLEEKLEAKLESKLTPIRKDIKSIKTKLAKIEKTVDILVRRTDEADVTLQRRVKRIEHHLSLSSPTS